MDHSNPSALSKFAEWLERNPTSVAGTICAKVADAMAAEFKTVVSIGFCYGARQTIDLVEAKKVKAACVCHPTFLKAEDAPAVKASGVPVLFNCASTDSLFVPELRAAFEKELAGDAKYKFIEYPNTQHGFAARPQGEEAVKTCELAHKNAAEFFAAHA